MDNKKIYDTLVEIQGQLEDAYYQLPDYNANSGGKSSLDGARCDVSYLELYWMRIGFYREKN